MAGSQSSLILNSSLPPCEGSRVLVLSNSVRGRFGDYLGEHRVTNPTMFQRPIQGGSSHELYKSVHSQVSTVGKEMLYNPRLTKDEEAFQNVMERL